jgi:bacterioferritin
MAMEEASTRGYNLGAIECAKNADAASKQLFEKLIQDEEGHFDAFEKRHENIQRFGPNYLALQSFGASAGAHGAIR